MACEFAICMRFCEKVASVSTSIGYVDSSGAGVLTFKKHIYTSDELSLAVPRGEI